MNPRYQLYIPSKGRYEKRLTSNYLSFMKVKHALIIEEHEYKKYQLYTKDNPFVRLIVLDKKYQEEYDPCDNLGITKSKGSGPARNFIWDYSISEGDDWHWIMDDNIRSFHRTNKNLRVRVSDGTIFRCMEDFIQRYKNVAMGGPHYAMFVPMKKKWTPFIHNTRIFSCNFIKNDLPFRWRARYNEDADLSLRLLKSGWCTILFFTFLQEKISTQKMKGGNTDEVYKDGTLDKSKMLARLHPDCTKVTWKYGRWHHHTNFNRFKKFKLIKKDNLEIESGVNNYGMELKNVTA